MSEDRADYEVIEDKAIMLSGASAIEAADRATIDVQIATAKRFPRDVAKFRRDALTLATADEKTAGSMFYTLPRKTEDGKRIEGPSVRLAEVIAHSWGNVRVEGAVVSIDEKHVTAQGTCFDLERNYAARAQVKVRITRRDGSRYGDDMIVVASNKAVSTAIRNAVFKVIPMSIVRTVYEEARKVSVGGSGTMEQKRKNALDWFAKQGVTEAKVFALLGRRGIEAVDMDDLVTLRGIRTAIEDGEVSAAEAFADKSAASRPADDLNAALGLNDNAPAVEGEAKAGPEPKPSSSGHSIQALKGKPPTWLCSCGEKFADADAAAFHADEVK